MFVTASPAPGHRPRILPIVSALATILSLVGLDLTTNRSAAQTQVPPGAAIYQTTCAPCHQTGLAGAPRFGDRAAWVDRVDQGRAILHEHAILGFQGQTGVMPPRGGNRELSDQAVRNAVDFMLDRVD